ncbi:MAG: family 20 glycosylhydrolase [Bacteroidota bacterium]|nr:family 20 glycosylhydrolase [Bacteroidota bacterium]
MKLLETKIIQWLLILLLIFKIASSKAESPSSNIIPKPVSIEIKQGVFLLNSPYIIAGKNVIAGQRFDETERLIGYLRDNLPMRYGQGGSFVSFEIADAPELISNEAYILEVMPNNIFIKAKTSVGVFYGIQTLLQLLPLKSEIQKSVSIPCQRIVDYPRFGWRGLHLDESRHFFGKDFAKKTIDLMAMLKLNVFHWHLTDDQGWRVEIKKYPKLTTMGAWRDDKRSEPWNYYQFASTPGKPQYGGFYTQADIKEIVNYAKERNITVVPEIDLPGHSAAAIYAYNWLSCNNKPWTIHSNSPFEFADPLCICDDKVVEFTKDILAEIIDIFPSEYIHIGGDECKHEAWKEVPLCKQIMEKEGLKTTMELQGRFNKQLESYIISKGRKMIGWDEILEGGISPTAAVMSWRGVEGGIEAAKHKHPFVMASSTHLYFDMPQSEGEITTSWLRTLPLEKVYSFDPIPSVLTPEEAKYMLGVEACLWTENMQTPEKVESQALPREIALAEIGWSPKGTNDFNEFKKRLQNFFPRLDAKGYNYFVPEPIGLNEKNMFLENAEVNLKMNYPYGVIRYTLDGTEPVNTSPQFTTVIIVDKPLTIKAKTFMPNGKTGRTISGTFVKGMLQEPLKIAKTPTKGLNYKYYELITNSLKKLDSVKVTKEGTIESFIFPKDVKADGWGIDYSGLIQITKDGVYTFSTASDDGSELYINGEKIVDNDGTHGIAEKSGMVALKAGFHAIRVRYFEGNYGESLQVSWEGPGVTKQLIPSINLYSK